MYFTEGEIGSKIFGHGHDSGQKYVEKKGAQWESGQNKRKLERIKGFWSGSRENEDTSRASGQKVLISINLPRPKPFHYESFQKKDFHWICN